MHDLLGSLLTTGPFIPHGHCYLWKPGLVWLHLLSDGLIAAAYYSIPLTLFYFVRRRQDLPFHWIFLLFAAFIVACGTTHLMEIWTLWNPTYWSSGFLKAVTAVVSVLTAILLVPLVPKALSLPSPAQLEQANRALELQIVERLKVEEELRHYQNQLEQRVQERTAELVAANQQLQQEICDRKWAETALHESRERLMLAQKVGSIGSCEWNFGTGVMTWTEEMEALYGLSPGSFAGTYDAWLGYLHPDDRPWLEQVVQQTLTQGTDFDTEFRILSRGSDCRWVAAKAQVFVDAVGKPSRLIGVNMDITARKHAEAEREQLLERERIAREAAESANRIKDEFLAVLSHELRSPLNPILGWAKLLRTRKFDEAATDRALETIERNAKLQTQLIDDLLDVSRILRGKLSLKSSAVNLETVVQAALETVQLPANAKSIQVETQFLAPSIEVLGDPNRLQQVVWNLLSNAVKFTPNEGRIAIRLRQVGRDVELQVEDSGKGIQPDFLPYVFDYFRQADGSSTRQFGGLGLGLAIARHIVELHGGSIAAASPGENQGAIFTVHLPVLQKPLPSVQKPLNLNSPDLSGVRVLVVDDEPDMRGLLAAILEESGAIVQLAASAPEALDALSQGVPDLVLSDIGMPGMDGHMLLQQIRSRPPQQGGNVRAIALTAYASEFDRQNALEAGFQLHVPKPVEPEALVVAIATVLQTR